MGRDLFEAIGCNCVLARMLDLLMLKLLGPFVSKRKSCLQRQKLVFVIDVDDMSRTQAGGKVQEERL